MTWIFYSWDRSIFQHQTICKYSVELGLVYKTFVNKHNWEKLSWKTNCIHVLHNVGFFGKLNKVLFPSQPKTHFFSDILPKQVPCSRMKHVDGALLLFLWSMRARARSFGRNAHISSSTLVYVKIHDRKHLWNLYKPRSKIFGTEILCYTSKLFLKLCPCLAWESNSLTV